MFAKDTRFLVVDDFSNMRKILKKILLELGYSQVDEAEDGDVALLMLRQAHDQGKPYGVIISDWNMPKLPGLDLLRACKSNPLLKNTPFIMVTAESEQTQIIYAVKAGVSEYVIKPFNSATMKDKLEKAFAKSGQNKNPQKAS